MKETKRIDPAALEGKEAIASGYKIFNWDWSAQNNYYYADENGEVEGSVHTVTGKINGCNWGLHYCKNPVDCMRYRDLIQWNKFAFVEAYDENIDDTDKSVCRTLKIVKVLSFEEMIEACKKYQVDNGNISGGSYIYGGSDIYGGSYIYGGNNLKHCRKCEGVSRCMFCFELEGAKLMLFNKPISEKRFNEVFANLGSWYPRFNNAEELKEKYGNGEWKNTPAPEIRGRTAKEAYADMPADLIAYVKSLPEYDEEIFKAITESE